MTRRLFFNPLASSGEEVASEQMVVSGTQSEVDIGRRPIQSENDIYDYEHYLGRAIRQMASSPARFHTVFPGWDNSGRRQKGAGMFLNSTPSAYRVWLASAISTAGSIIDGSPLVFINAWNEWAEGAHLEPCQKWDHAYLEATRDALRAAQVVKLKDESRGKGSADLGLRLRT